MAKKSLNQGWLTKYQKAGTVMPADILMDPKKLEQWMKDHPETRATAPQVYNKKTRAAAEKQIAARKAKDMTESEHLVNDLSNVGNWLEQSLLNSAPASPVQFKNPSYTNEEAEKVMPMGVLAGAAAVAPFAPYVLAPLEPIFTNPFVIDATLASGLYEGVPKAVDAFDKYREGKWYDASKDASEGALYLSPAIGTIYEEGVPFVRRMLNTENVKDAILRNALSAQLRYGKPRFATEAPPPIRRIDPIGRSSVGVKNDIRNFLTEDEYNEFLADAYRKNKGMYDRPLIEFKSSRPKSFVKGVGTTSDREGILFKEKFCLPGSECAKTANSVTSKLFTDVTGQPFEAVENAHNAWHMEDQMTRHGGINVTSSQPKLGDRILMGNSRDQSTYFPGYTADPRVRHAGMFAGYMQTEHGPIPMILESGHDNPLYLNPINNTFTGPNTVKEAIRPAQFIGNQFGQAMVDKNIRYAFRDKPPVATYSSDNTHVQGLLTRGEEFREPIKRTYDLTNDEYNELLNSLIGIGIQETKLNAKLPGSTLSKAKVQLQNALNEAGLLKPIKQTINTVKKVSNSSEAAAASNLPSYPGAAKIEMEAARYSNDNNIPFEEALNLVKSKYQPKPTNVSLTVEPSKGMFRQKFQTETDRLSNFGSNLKGENSLENAMGQMATNYQKAKKAYPDASPRQLIDITTLMWNSPTKAMNKDLVEFYIFGKNNPNPTKFNFSYINKINNYKNRYLNVKPQRVEPHFEFFRNKSYPEIQYKYGGKTWLNKYK
jgi:hypothetical protein